MASPPRCHDECSSQKAYRSALAVADDLATAWAAVSADPSVDVGDIAERHVAGARIGRAMCAQLGTSGHRMPSTVVPCRMSVTSSCGREMRLAVDDHLLLITDRAVLDLGLARFQAAGLPPVVCAERTSPWPDQAGSLEVVVADLTLRYRPTDHRVHRRSQVWRRTNRDWKPVFERLHDHMSRLWSERGPYWSRPPLGVHAAVGDTDDQLAGRPSSIGADERTSRMEVLMSPNANPAGWAGSISANDSECKLGSSGGRERPGR